MYKMTQKGFLLASVLFSVLLVAEHTQAATVLISGVDTEIGDLDVFTGDTTYLKTPTEQAEADWLSTLGLDVTADSLVKTEIADGDFIAVDADGIDNTYVYTSQIIPSDYFLLKTKDKCDPKTKACQDNIFLFKNSDLLSYAYIDITGLMADWGIVWSDIDTISHLSAGISAIPLPGAVWLFGSALLGFGFLRGVVRRNKP